MALSTWTWQVSSVHGPRRERREKTLLTWNYLEHRQSGPRKGPRRDNLAPALVYGSGFESPGLCWGKRAPPWQFPSQARHVLQITCSEQGNSSHQKSAGRCPQNTHTPATPPVGGQSHRLATSATCTCRRGPVLGPGADRPKSGWGWIWMDRFR